MARKSLVALFGVRGVRQRYMSWPGRALEDYQELPEQILPGRSVQSSNIRLPRLPKCCQKLSSNSKFVPSLQTHIHFSPLISFNRRPPGQRDLAETHHCRVSDLEPTRKPLTFREVTLPIRGKNGKSTTIWIFQPVEALPADPAIPMPNGKAPFLTIPFELREKIWGLVFAGSALVISARSIFEDTMATGGDDKQERTGHDGKETLEASRPFRAGYHMSTSSSYFQIRLTCKHSPQKAQLCSTRKRPSTCNIFGVGRPPCSVPINP